MVSQGQFKAMFLKISHSRKFQKVYRMGMCCWILQICFHYLMYRYVLVKCFHNLKMQSIWEKIRLLIYFQKPQINPQIMKGGFLTSTVNSIRALDYLHWLRGIASEQRQPKSQERRAEFCSGKIHSPAKILQVYKCANQ